MVDIFQSGASEGTNRKKTLGGVDGEEGGGVGGNTTEEEEKDREGQRNGTREYK